MASETEKEQAKLTATYVNGIAVTVFALGCASPILASIFGTSPLGHVPAQLLIAGLVCLFVSLSLHFLARLILKRGLGR